MLGNARRTTEDGHLVCEAVPIARVGEQLYRPMELAVGLKPNAAGYVVVKRLPEEVFSPESLASFEGKPLVIGHPVIAQSPGRVIGRVENVRRGEGADADAVVADIVLDYPLAIVLLERQYPELSAGYDADYYQSEDGVAIQRNIVGLHVAAVARGRASGVVGVA